MIRRSFSSPAPERRASRTAGLRRRFVALHARRDQHPRREPHRQLLEILRPAPLERLDRFDRLRASCRPGGRAAHPWRVISASVRTPDALPIATSDSASRRESSGVFMNAPLARLHVEHQAADALRDLLAHDRRADERDALDRAGDVAQRVELPIGRGDLGGLADQGAADRGERGPQLGQRQGRPEAREWPRACRACRRCARARGPTSSARARRRPRPAARGSATSCRRPRRCCACRPACRGGPDSPSARRSGPSRRSAQRSPRPTCRGAGSPSAARPPGSPARLPSVTPATKNSISAAASAPPSRLCRMRSTARIQGSVRIGGSAGRMSAGLQAGPRTGLKAGATVRDRSVPLKSDTTID